MCGELGLVQTWVAILFIAWLDSNRRIRKERLPGACNGTISSCFVGWRDAVRRQSRREFEYHGAIARTAPFLAGTLARQLPDAGRTTIVTL